MRDLRAGVPGAFARVYGLHNRAIYSFLLRLSRRRDVADDLFQETWLRLQRHAPRLTPDTRLLPWLLTVARNLHRSYLRWRVLDLSRFFEGDDVPLIADAAEVKTTAEVREELLATERALGRISAGSREILLLAAMDELSPSEIHELLRTKGDAYRQRLSRARKELREALGKR